MAWNAKWRADIADSRPLTMSDSHGTAPRALGQGVEARVSTSGSAGRCGFFARLK